MDKAVLDVIGPDSAAAVGLSVREPEVGVSSLTLPAAVELAQSNPIESCFLVIAFQQHHAVAQQVIWDLTLAKSMKKPKLAQMNSLAERIVKIKV